MTLTEDYLREVEATLSAEPERRRRIVEELRSHLREKMAEVRRREPDRAEEDVEREVLRDFGSPRDLALAYGTEGPVLVNRAGDTVMRVGQAVGRGASSAARAVGRGTGRLLKGVAIALAALLTLGVVGGVWAYYEFKPYVLAMAEESRPVYAFAQTCWETPCDAGEATQTFYVKPDARQVRFVLNVGGPDGWHPRVNASGDLRVALVDPEGNVRYERAVSLVDGGRFHQELQWAGVPGNWTVTVSATQLVGQLDARAYVSSAPWDHL